MKSKFLFLFLFVTSIGFSQNVNDYAAVLVPLRYEFTKSDNQYRLSTLTKYNLEKAGFVAYYSSDLIPDELNVNNRCNLLTADVQRENAFLVTKLYVVFKDCFGKEVFKSEVGKSKEKEFEVCYAEALNNAFKSVYALNYKYSGKVAASNNVSSPYVTQSGSVTVVNSAAVSQAVAPAVVGTAVLATGAEADAKLLYAQPIKNGYQLVDSTPKVVMKVFKTSNPATYQAIKGNIQGLLVLKENQWFFEYYEDETLKSEKIPVKF